MPDPELQNRSRRALFRFLAASPLAAAAFARQADEGIASAADALNVFDFEPVARRKLPPAHFGYIATGVDGDDTLRANREGFTRYQIRSRRLIDVSRIDTSVRLFGAEYKNPIVLAPAGSQRAFHPEGEVAVARAARSKGNLQILSHNATSSVEDVTSARGAPIWFQLYAASEWNVSRAIVKRAESAGCPVLVFTVDQLSGSNRETLRHFQQQDKRQCTVCHVPGADRSSGRKPAYHGLDLKGVQFQPRNLTWDYVRRLRDATSMKLVVKGLVAREDAELAVQYGADGIICSNHGGRAEESARPSIESLVEVVEGAAGRVPVLVDSGFRRGTDVFKALALGASAVCIGRPYLWGLAAFGAEGVEAVLAILARELELAMRYAGTTSLETITRTHVVNGRR